jgi:hypothetical protein
MSKSDGVIDADVLRASAPTPVDDDAADVTRSGRARRQ